MRQVFSSSATAAIGDLFRPKDAVLFSFAIFSSHEVGDLNVFGVDVDVLPPSTPHGVAEDGDFLAELLGSSPNFLKTTVVALAH